MASQNENESKDKSQNEAKDRSQTETETKSETGKNALEWAVFGLSSVLVLGFLGWLLFQTLNQNGSPPRLEISLGAPVVKGQRVMVPVKVENRGDETAESVEIEVARAGEKEVANFSFPHVPRHGEREGYVEFDAPLEKSDLEAKILGFEAP